MPDTVATILSILAMTAGIAGFLAALRMMERWDQEGEADPGRPEEAPDRGETDYGRAAALDVAGERPRT